MQFTSIASLLFLSTILCSTQLFGQRINLEDPSSISTPQLYSQYFPVIATTIDANPKQLILVENYQKEKEEFSYNAQGLSAGLKGYYHYNQTDKKYYPSVSEEYVYNKLNRPISSTTFYVSETKATPYHRTQFQYDENGRRIQQLSQYWLKSSGKWTNEKSLNIRYSQHEYFYVSADSTYDPTNRKVIWQKNSFDSLTNTEKSITLIENLQTSRTDTLSCTVYTFNDKHQIISSLLYEPQGGGFRLIPVRKYEYKYEKNGFVSEEKCWSYDHIRDTLVFISQLDINYSEDLSRAESLFWFRLNENEPPVPFRKTLFHYDPSVPYNRLRLPPVHEKNPVLFHHQLNKIEYFKINSETGEWVFKESIDFTYK